MRVSLPIRGESRGPGRLLLVPAILAGLLSACDEQPVAIEPQPDDPCAGYEVSLQVGETLGPWKAATVCLQPAAGAEYAMAVMDPRAILSAATGWEASFDRYLVSVRLISATTAPATIASPTIFEPGHSHNMASSLEAEPEGNVLYDRASPWVLGEEFPLTDQNNMPRTARVVRIYGDSLVFAWIEGDRPDELEEFLDRLDLAVQPVREIAWPLMQHVFVPRLPVTSSGSGQYMVILMAPDRWSGGAAYSTVRGDSIRSVITLTIDPTFSVTILAWLLAHEMTHSYQRMYQHETRPTGTPHSYHSRTWADEGGANLISYEMLRRMAGIPLDGNFDWRNPHPTPPAEMYAHQAQPGSGDFIVGYDNSMGFLRDLIIRRVRTGEPIDDAVRAVSRGAIEGWHGFDRSGARRLGLTNRMRERLGEGWQPAIAMLDWILSHAADDLTTNPEYQDHASLRIWDIPAATTYAWRPAGILSASTPGVSFERRGGSPEYLYLHDGGDGLAFTVSSNISSLQWKLLRLR
jgi:hypothetical protein